MAGKNTLIRQYQSKHHQISNSLFCCIELILVSDVAVVQRGISAIVCTGTPNATKSHEVS